MIKDTVFFISQYYKNPDSVDLKGQAGATPSTISEQLTRCLAITWLSRSSSTDDLQNIHRLNEIRLLAQYGYTVFVYEFAIEFFLQNKSEPGLIRALSYVALGDLRYKQDIFCSTNIAWMEKATDLTAIYLGFLQKLALHFLKRPFHEIMTPKHQSATAEATIELLLQWDQSVATSPSWLTFHRPETDLAPGKFVPPEKMSLIRQLFAHQAAWSAAKTRASLLEGMSLAALSRIESDLATGNATSPALIQNQVVETIRLSHMKMLISEAQRQQAFSAQALCDAIEEA